MMRVSFHALSLRLRICRSIDEFECRQTILDLAGAARENSFEPQAMKNRNLLAALACLLCSGCATHNVNPPAPRANTGYVDFYTDSNVDLSWEVKRSNQGDHEMKTVFSEFDPLPGNILRLPAPPGVYHFQVWFMNLYTTGPEIVEVQVADAKVTPVHVTLSSSGITSANRTTYQYRPTVRATRAVPRIVTEEKQTFKISATVATPVDYQPKERMPYFPAAEK
jgi:hypothetical protein